MKLLNAYRAYHGDDEQGLRKLIERRRHIEKLMAAGILVPDKRHEGEKKQQT